ncbi:MAG: hypothetical protein JST82_07685 [Bacteroidetes bacterium]|nr:hypothetical protein [Bacteroidota bacterium]
MNCKAIALYTACALVMVFNASAQKSNSGSNHIYINAAVDYHINNWDVNNTDPEDGYGPGDGPIQDGLLRVKNNAGARLGVQYLRISKNRMLFSAGFDFKVVPQSVQLIYKASENGYAGSTYEYNKNYSFNNFAIDFKGNVGYSINIVPHKGKLDIGMGFIFDIPLNGEDNSGGEVVYANTGSSKQDLIMVEQVGWGSRKYQGNTENNFPLNFLGNVQIAYRFAPGTIFNDRGFKIGVDFSSILLGNYNNNIYINAYTANRANRFTQSFKDEMTSVSFVLGIEL